MQTLIPFVLIAAILALIGGIYVVSMRMEKARIEALTAASRAMGFTFEPDGDLEVMKGSGPAACYGHGH